jgi:hypothetical protein
MMAVRGKIQGAVVHLVAHQLIDLSEDLASAACRGRSRRPVFRSTRWATQRSLFMTAVVLIAVIRPSRRAIATLAVAAMIVLALAQEALVHPSLKMLVIVACSGLIGTRSGIESTGAGTAR